MAFSGPTPSTAPVIPPTPFVGSFGGFEGMRTLASPLYGVVAVADDL